MEDGEIEEAMVTEEVSQPATRPIKVGKAPLDMLRDSKASIEDVVAKMLSIKNEGKPKSEVRELLMLMFLSFVTLREVNREILLEEDRVKAETERAKAPVDFTTLQLHNLMYEKNHYVKAIKACKDFKSKYPDIELVPENEYLRDAPEEIKASTLANNSSHDLMLKRLDYELHQRKELCNLRAKLEQKKKSLLETIANRKKFLSSLPSHLKSLKKASIPVQNQLGFQHTKKLKQHHLAELLPPPLYIIYSQLLAQKEAFEEKIDLEIAGSLKDAQAFARRQANQDTDTSKDTESSRLEDEALDEDDDGQRRRKRPKKVPSKEGLDQAGLYQAHPLKVIVHIFDDENTNPTSIRLISLKFDYLLKLNTVHVGIDGPQEGVGNDILCNLFPDDTGLELPHQSAKLIVNEAQASDQCKTSRPYKWAQHLAGIDFLTEVSPFLTGVDAAGSNTAKKSVFLSGLSLYRQQNRVQTVLERIRSRKKAQLALVKQYDTLRKFEWPALVSKSFPWALHNPLCRLESWSAVGSASNGPSSRPLTGTEQVQEPMDVDIDGKSISAKEDLEGTREDGELPSLATAGSTTNNVKLTPTKMSVLDHSMQLNLMSKSLVSPINKGTSSSFKRYDNDLDLVADPDSDLDEPALAKAELEDASSDEHHERVDKTWINYGTGEYRLILSRKTISGDHTLKLEAKVQISLEYPLRPPHFVLSLLTSPRNETTVDYSERHNELHAMEAEVNLHILKMIPLDQQNHILSHQIRCLAMLFDYYTDDESSPRSKKGKTTSVADVGLCEPVSGELIARSFRGRDRRKMISWKEMGCASGYPN